MNTSLKIASLYFVLLSVEWTENTACIESYWLYSVVFHYPKHISWEEIE